MPWTPISQSKMSSTSSKSVSSVTATCSVGSSEFLTGEKRESWRAEMRAYSGMPSDRSCDSKVPMQPRSMGSPSSMVFHVTNSGAELGGIGREEVLVAGVEAPSEVDEEEDEALASGTARC